MPLKIALLLAASSLAVSTLAEAQTLAGPAAPPAPVFAPAAATAAAAANSQGVPAPLFAPGASPVFKPSPVKPGDNPFAQMDAPNGHPASPTPTAANPFVATAATASPSAAAAFSIEAPAAEPNAGTASETPAAVDETALRYYAASRDLVRVGSEIRRLKSLYRDWQPPADLFATAPSIDETPFWELYAKGDLAGIRKRMAEQKKATPDWNPSVDLTAKIDDAEARAAISGALERGDWQSIIAAAGKRPSLLVCANMNVLWSLGEAYARAGNFSRSFDLYAYILKSCDDPAERLATFQKARALLPPAGAQSLIAYGRPLASGGTEFSSVKFDDLRAVMGRAAAGDATQLPDAASLAEFANDVASTRSADDAMLFGWYFYGVKQWASAADWFKAAAALTPDPKAIEGRALALRNQGDLAGAETLAYDNRGRSGEIAKIFIEIVSNRLTENDATGVIDDGSMERFRDVVQFEKSALGAQSIGWHEVAGDNLPSAKDWFQKSVSWQPTKEGVLGLAVVAARTKDRGELKKIKATYGATVPELATFNETAPARTIAAPRRTATSAGNRTAGNSSASNTLMAQANAAFKSGDYRSALSLLQQRKARYGHNGGAEILEGWANLKLSRWEEARTIFKAEDKRNSTKDTRFGIGAVSNSQYNAW